MITLFMSIEFLYEIINEILLEKNLLTVVQISVERERSSITITLKSSPKVKLEKCSPNLPSSDGGFEKEEEEKDSFSVTEIDKSGDWLEKNPRKIERRFEREDDAKVGILDLDSNEAGFDAADDNVGSESISDTDGNDRDSRRIEPRGIEPSRSAEDIAVKIESDDGKIAVGDESEPPKDTGAGNRHRQSRAKPSRATNCPAASG